MDPTEYFDTHTVGSLVREDYDSDELPVLREAEEVYECKSCGSLVTKDDRDKHAQWHELQSALIRRLETIANTSRRA